MLDAAAGHPHLMAARAAGRVGAAETGAEPRAAGSGSHRPGQGRQPPAPGRGRRRAAPRTRYRPLPQRSRPPPPGPFCNTHRSIGFSHQQVDGRLETHGEGKQRSQHRRHLLGTQTRGAPGRRATPPPAADAGDDPPPGSVRCRSIGRTSPCRRVSRPTVPLRGSGTAGGELGGRRGPRHRPRA